MHLKSPTSHAILSEPNYRVGIISFTDPRSDVEFVEKREEYIKQCHMDLATKLQRNGFEVINPQNASKEKIFGINSLDQIDELQQHFLRKKISALIIGCFAWNEPNGPIALAKKVEVPIGLVTRNNPLWPGVTAIASTGASFWESSVNYHVKNHSRFLLPREGSIESIIPWLKAACAIDHLKRGKLLLWGGSPALNMEHLNDAIPYLKRFIIGDIENQDQYMLVKQAEKVSKENPDRISKFKKWLSINGCKILYDDKMITENILDKQIALYLAGKDILNDFHSKGERIIGTSIKCQPELSVEYGITPCLLPAFLPFSEDHEGRKPVVPTVCEGDIKGLLTSAILYSLNKSIPPLFGDIKVITNDYFIIANCGAASAYYAALTDDLMKTLSNSHIEPQCQGVAGGAFGYHTPPSKEETTYVRICRIDGTYVLQYGIGKIVSIKEKQEFGWGTTWPHTAIEIKVKPDLFIRAIGTNHLSLTLGNFHKELIEISKMLDIPIVRLDDENSLQNFLSIY